MARGCPKRHFEENQISLSLIRLSLLPTAHDRTFQRSRLRAFCPFYGTFTLAMGRSQSFGSYADDSFAILRLAFTAAPSLEDLALPPTYTRRSIMQKVRSQPLPLRAIGLLPRCKCMVSGAFHSANSCAFHRSIALLVHYRSSRSI